MHGNDPCQGYVYKTPNTTQLIISYNQRFNEKRECFAENSKSIRCVHTNLAIGT